MDKLLPRFVVVREKMIIESPSPYLKERNTRGKERIIWTLVLFNDYSGYHDLEIVILDRYNTPYVTSEGWMKRSTHRK